jgi:uncharacterized protein YegP (UPF0339 family)
MEAQNEQFRAAYYDWDLRVYKAENGEWALRLYAPDQLEIEGGETYRYEDDAKSEALQLVQTYFDQLQDTRPQLSSVEWFPL